MSSIRRPLPDRLNMTTQKHIPCAQASDQPVFGV